MIEVEFDKRDMKRIKKGLAKLNPKDHNSVVNRGFKRLGLHLEKALIYNVNNRILRQRTGRLISSIQSIVKKTSDGLLALVGSGVRNGKRVPYANILEKGGTVTPKNSKYLAIPLKAALTKAKANRQPHPRDFVNTFFQVSKNGNLILFQKSGKKKITPLFVMKKSVKIRAKRYLSKTARAENKSVVKMMIREIERGVNV